MRVLFAGGGTGGHLLPGILIARRLREEGDEVRFLVSGRAVENSFFDEERLDRVTLALERRGGGAPGRISLAARLPAAVYSAFREIRRFRPDVVLGIGGFVSLPAGIASRLRGVPLDLLEINAIPGKATRALKPFSRRVYCGYEETLRRVGRRGLLTGTPLRPELGRVDRSAARRKLGLDPDLPTLLVMGGSQGASALNELLFRGLPSLARAKVQLLLITGQKDFEKLRSAAERAGVRASSFAFLKEMEEAYAAADLALCRGGAATVAELAAAGLPSVIVPYPLHRDHHQWWNGRQLQEGAVLIEESEAFEKGLENAVLPLLFDASRLSQMKGKLQTVSRAWAVDKILQALRAKSAFSFPEPAGKR